MLHRCVTFERRGTSLNLNKVGAYGSEVLPVRHPMAAPVLSEKAWKLMSDEALNAESFTADISLLGSTGSIGTQTLDIVRARPDKFRYANTTSCIQPFFKPH